MTRLTTVVNRSIWSLVQFPSLEGKTAHTAADVAVTARLIVRSWLFEGSPNLHQNGQDASDQYTTSTQAYGPLSVENLPVNTGRVPRHEPLWAHA